MRELSRLIDVEDPGRASIHQLQVTARSYLGALVLHCGGLLVDDGWLRVFGSPVGGAAPESPTLARVNQFPAGHTAVTNPAIPAPVLDRILAAAAAELP